MDLVLKEITGPYPLIGLVLLLLGGLVKQLAGDNATRRVIAFGFLGIGALVVVAAFTASFIRPSAGTPPSPSMPESLAPLRVDGRSASGVSNAAEPARVSAVPQPATVALPTSPASRRKRAASKTIGSPTQEPPASSTSPNPLEQRTTIVGDVALGGSNNEQFVGSDTGAATQPGHSSQQTTLHGNVTMGGTNNKQFIGSR